MQLDHLGDAVLSTTLLPPLRRRYPRASLEVLTSPWNQELFALAPEVDRVHVLAKNRFARPRRFGALTAMLWCGWRLRRRKIDLAIDVRGEFPLALMIWLSGARWRLGWDCGGGGFLLTDSPDYVADRPEVESRRALLAALGIHPEPGEEFAPAVSPSEVVRRRVAEWLDNAEGTHPTDALDRRLRIAVHVGAGTPAKRWPDDHWRDLVAWLVVRLGAEVVLVGGKEERIIARHITGRSPYRGVIDWTGQLGVAELAAVIGQSDLFVGADSGPAHLAAAVGTPAVVLFSGTNDPRQWRPWGSGVTVVRREVRCSPCHGERCPLRDHPCMKGLEVEAVARVVQQAIRGACYAEA